MAVASESPRFDPKPFGRYVLLDKLAVGGMAEIYKAKTYGVDGFEKLLAIKRILPHCAADKDFIHMLVDEAKLTVLLSHANIVQVYDLGKVGDDYFISMEFISGTNLREVLYRLVQKGEKLREDLAVYIISEMCKGLDYAHRKSDSHGVPLNIVHRDISPQNILISYEGEVKIVDFGIAKAAMNVSQTMAGILKGKVAYMSPEQALGKPVDHRTDIFSAGIVLYEMLTGEKLFTGETQFEVLNQIRSTRVNEVMLPQKISAALKTILTKALTYNPRDRYQSAGDFQLDLTKYLYSSYIDFSPRHLASIVSRLFEQELRKKESPQHPLDEKTRSVLTQQAQKENIVVHGMPLRGETAITQKTGVSEVYSLPAVRKRRRSRALIGLLGITAVAAYLGYRALLEEPPVEPPEARPPVAIDLGTFQVDSNPPGARIFLNGRDTGLTTPARLEKLSLGRDYEIHLQKEKYQEVKKEYALTTTKLISVREDLVALPLGVIEITSSPAGARIFVDGTELQGATPSRLEKLELQKTYQIRLALGGHADWLGSVEVKNFEPVKLAAVLTPLPSQEPPPQVVAEPPPPPTPPPLKPKEEAPPATGEIRIRSTPPGANVFVDGRKTGEVTPTTLRELKPGRNLSISLSKNGYEIWRQSVSVQPGEKQNLIASLREVPPAPKPEPRIETPKEETPPPPPPPKIEKVEEPPPPPRAAVEPPKSSVPASLKVDSKPSGADVFINSEFRGTTPVRVANISPGTIKVMVSKEGFLRHDAEYSLKPGENRVLGTIRLEGLYGELVINSSPPRASIYFDGALIAPRTPVTIRKVPRDRPHRLRLILKGYKPWEASFTLKDRESSQYNVVFEKD